MENNKNNNSLQNQDNFQEGKEFYELAFFLKPHLQEEEVNLVIKGIEDLINKQGGEIIYSEPPLLKSLAYPIKKLTEGYFSFIQFKYFKEKINELKNQIDDNSNFLRYLLIRLNPEEDVIYLPEAQKKPSTFQKPKEKERKKKISPKEKVSSEEKEISLEELEKKLEEILKQ